MGPVRPDPTAGEIGPQTRACLASRTSSHPTHGPDRDFPAERRLSVPSGWFGGCPRARRSTRLGRDQRDLTWLLLPAATSSSRRLRTEHACSSCVSVLTAGARWRFSASGATARAAVEAAGTSAPRRSSSRTSSQTSRPASGASASRPADSRQSGPDISRVRVRMVRGQRGPGSRRSADRTAPDRASRCHSLPERRRRTATTADASACGGAAF